LPSHICFPAAASQMLAGQGRRRRRAGAVLVSAAAQKRSARRPHTDTPSRHLAGKPEDGRSRVVFVVRIQVNPHMTPILAGHARGHVEHCALVSTWGFTSEVVIAAR